MLNFLYEFLPILLFFIAFKFYDIYLATIIGIAATAIQLLITSVWKKKIDRKQLFTLIIFVVFGGMTLYFHNPIFVKWKPSIIFWVFGIALLISQFVGKKTIMQRMLEKVLEGQATLPHSIWGRLNAAWSVFFLVLGTVNILVAYSFSTDVWVNFKFYGIMSLLLLFSLMQAVYLSRFVSDKT